MSDAQIYKKAAASGGWIFPPSKNTPYECEWGDIYEFLAQEFELKGKRILDIGTAEGLKLMQLADLIESGAGIDLEPGMIDLANKYKEEKGITNIEFLVMSSGNIGYPDSSFDVITARHAPVDLTEVKRLLKPGGVFITQQVHERDKQNLKEHFGRGQNYKVTSNTSLNKILKDAEDLNFEEVKSYFSDMPYYFNSKEDLQLFLEKTPVIPDYKNSEEKILDDFIHNNTTPKGICSNSSRYLIVMNA